MRGTVTKLCEIDSIDIPDRMREIRIDRQRIREEIDALSLRYAEESEAEVAAAGDIVRCRARKTDYPDGRAILIFTGTDLPGVEIAAEDSLGKRRGDTFTTELAGKTAELTVESIHRRTPAVVNDALIAAMGMAGVSTVEDYRGYLTEKAKADAELEAGKKVMHYLMDEMINRSEFSYDEDELRAATEKAKADYAAAPEADDYVPDDEEFAEAVLGQFKQSWAAEAFCRQRGILPDENTIREQARQLGQMMELMGENVPGEAELSDMALTEECLNRLFEYMNGIVAQKIGG